jgi:hypothetical protein
MPSYIPAGESRCSARLRRALQALHAANIRRDVQESDFVRELAKTGLRNRHPEYTEAEIARELIRQLYGDLPRCK